MWTTFDYDNIYNCYYTLVEYIEHEQITMFLHMVIWKIIVMAISLQPYNLTSWGCTQHPFHHGTNHFWNRNIICGNGNASHHTVAPSLWREDSVHYCHTSEHHCVYLVIYSACHCKHLWLVTHRWRSRHSSGYCHNRISFYCSKGLVKLPTSVPSVSALLNCPEYRFNSTKLPPTRLSAWRTIFSWSSRVLSETSQWLSKIATLRSHFPE